MTDTDPCVNIFSEYYWCKELTEIIMSYLPHDDREFVKREYLIQSCRAAITSSRTTEEYKKFIEGCEKYVQGQLKGAAELKVFTALSLNSGMKCLLDSVVLNTNYIRLVVLLRINTFIEELVVHRTAVRRLSLIILSEDLVDDTIRDGIQKVLDLVYKIDKWEKSRLFIQTDDVNLWKTIHSQRIVALFIGDVFEFMEHIEKPIPALDSIRGKYACTDIFLQLINNSPSDEYTGKIFTEVIRTICNWGDYDNHVRFFQNITNKYFIKRMCKYDYDFIDYIKQDLMSVEELHEMAADDMQKIIDGHYMHDSRDDDDNDNYVANKILKQFVFESPILSIPLLYRIIDGQNEVINNLLTRIDTLENDVNINQSDIRNCEYSIENINSSLTSKK